MRADLRSVNWHDLFLNLNVSGKGLVITDIFFGHCGQAHFE